jgi:hypothetical protein
VLVHGAWFDASCWDAVIAEFHDLGASAVAVDLPLNGFDADVALVRNAIEAAGPVRSSSHILTEAASCPRPPVGIPT